jgi:hypothetical protein
MAITLVRRCVRGIGPVVVAAMMAALAAAPDAAAASAGDAAGVSVRLVLTGPAAGRQLPAGFHWVERSDVVAAAAAGYKNIGNPNSGRCIGISMGLAGIWDCTRNADQLWGTPYDDVWGGPDGLLWASIRNDKGECLGIWGGSTEAGARAVGFTCLPHEDQYWRVLADDSGNSYLANMNAFYSTSSAWILGVNGGLKDNGTQIVLFWPDGTFNQRWCWLNPFGLCAADV